MMRQPKYLELFLKTKSMRSSLFSKIAQDIFENKELRMLFDTARDAEPEDVFPPIVFQIFISYKYILATAPVVFF